MPEINFAECNAAIRAAVGKFDFEKVHACMKLLEWRWFENPKRAPNVEEIKRNAEHLFFVLMDEMLKDYGRGQKYSVAAGGLEVTSQWYEDRGAWKFKLEFIPVTCEYSTEWV